MGLVKGAARMFSIESPRWHPEDIAGSEVNFAILQEDFPSVPADCFAHALVYGLEGAAEPVKGEGQDG